MALEKILIWGRGGREGTKYISKLRFLKKKKQYISNMGCEWMGKLHVWWVLVPASPWPLELSLTSPEVLSIPVDFIKGAIGYS